jgi:hypothetical protein
MGEIHAERGEDHAKRADGNKQRYDDKTDEGKIALYPPIVPPDSSIILFVQ